MAESKNNVVTKGLSGKMGNIVFRQCGDKTIATSAPGPRTKPGTQGQQATRSRFQKAVFYGQGVLADPEAKEMYQATAMARKAAYHVAIADFMNAPDILEVDFTEYTGLPHQRIRIKVTDDFEVKSVMLTIHNADGTLVEEGDAIQDPADQYWVYTTNAENPTLEGDKISIAATDNPENMSVEQWDLKLPQV